jgi:outer membrane protein OmpA-like peptidoglycan-associated protein
VTQYGKTELTVLGHTDAEGSAQSNQELSMRRAHAVTEYLHGKNVHRDRLEAIGKGETEPVSDNKTDAGRRANRRVEILVEPIRAD